MAPHYYTVKWGMRRHHSSNNKAGTEVRSFAIELPHIGAAVGKRVSIKAQLVLTQQPGHM